MLMGIVSAWRVFIFISLNFFQEAVVKISGPVDGAEGPSHGCHRAIHVFLEDYIDRGPDSRKVLDLISEESRNDRRNAFP
jgi:hypothetical protein